MDKSWINLNNRRLPQYEEGVRQFLSFAYATKDVQEKIRCPCKRCNNVLYQSRDDVEADLLQYGFIKDYAIWMLHGEELPDSDSDEDEDEGMIDGHDINEGRENIAGADGYEFFDTQDMSRRRK
ncbi:uncharacterized protein LOC131011265 [Salvia miltiorrhiza]|uniref:uncharacterized protein LOC131011265 n=1 Tax=Salvia miltiorrhiza TaxID=226208 RepID=UPI0025AD9C71|nr:uncharacterized protein LOC131011265 [Salvia miltiorrhiza]